jgi:cytidylate kinase
MVMHTNAEHGNVIIIGRGGCFILKDKSFRVRIIAPQKARVEKVMRDRRMSESDALAFVHKYDEYQIGFMKKYFKEDIKDPKHYDMMVNTEKVGIDSAAESIKKAFLLRHAMSE